LLRNRSLFAFVLAAIVTLCAASSAFSVEPIKIARDDVALDLSGAVEIYRNQGENFQVSTARLDGTCGDEVEPLMHARRRLGCVCACQHHRPAARQADRRRIGW
jgi:hypothetical protein